MKHQLKEITSCPICEHKTFKTFIKCKDHNFSNDVFNIDQTYRQISELLGKGVLVSPRRPEFTYTKLATKRVDMLAKATKDAHTRAEAIVQQTGSELGNVRKVDTGVFQITIPNSTRVSSWGSYDTSTIKKDITAVMGVTFEVN